MHHFHFMNNSMLQVEKQVIGHITAIWCVVVDEDLAKVLDEVSI